MEMQLWRYGGCVIVCFGLARDIWEITAFQNFLRVMKKYLCRELAKRKSWRCTLCRRTQDDACCSNTLDDTTNVTERFVTATMSCVDWRRNSSSREYVTNISCKWDDEYLANKMHGRAQREPARHSVGLDCKLVPQHYTCERLPAVCCITSMR